jgi:hypothetical protein
MIHDLVKAIQNAVAALFRALNIFGKDAQQMFLNYFTNVINGAILAWSPIVSALGGTLEPTVRGVISQIEAHGPGIAEAIRTPISAYTRGLITAASDGLTTLGESTPDNAIASAGNAMGDAFGAGLASAGVAAAFAAIFPKELNVLDSAAPILAEMAGYKEVAGTVLEPLYANAFGRSLDYHYRSVFKPELPDEADAVQWHSRRLLNDDQLRVLFNYSGLKSEYEQPFVDNAYRAVQPRSVMALLQDVDFPLDPMRHLLEFAGWRDVDINLVLPLMQLNSTKNVRAQYLSALVRAVELGTDTPANLTRAMTDMQYSQDAQNWVQLTVAERKLEQLAELYRKSVSESYKYGTLSDAQYVPALEAIGINSADAQAHYAIDSIAKQGKILAAALKAEERLAAQRTSAAMKAAIAEYRAGTIDSLALEAALLAAGVDPTIASFAVVVQTARTEGTLVMVYGVELGHTAALLLKEKVAAFKEQAIKKLGAPAGWLSELKSLGIPDANAQALVSEWEAQANKVAIPV